MRRLLPLLLAALAVTGCPQRVRRPAGDDAPYPTLDGAALDREGDPCDDFYQYACGGWIAQTPVPPDRIRWVRGAGAREVRNAQLLRRILEDAGAGKVGSQERFGRKAGDFYAACLDEADVEASGLAELQAEWARLDAVSDRSDLGDELARLESMGLHVPFALRARPDPSTAGRMLLAIGDEGAGLAAPAPGPAPDAAGQADWYLEHVQAMLQLARVPPGRAAQEATRAAGLVRALGGPAPAAPGAEPPLVRVGRAELQQLAPAIPWPRLLRALGGERLEAVAITDPAFVSRVGRLLGEAPLEDWKAYLRVRLLETLAARRALPASLAEESLRHLRALGPVPAEPRPRWEHCVEETAAALPFATGAAFARRHLGGGRRERAGWLVAAVQRGMLVTVESAPWIDAATQSRAATKLGRMAVQLGYPDAGPDYGALRVGRSSYFRNVLSVGRFQVAQEVARALRPLDREEWLQGPFETRTSYAPDRNVLSVPAGALQPPVYEPQDADPVVLGAMGTAIGRRLAEAFEGEGRRRGPEGAVAPQWTPAAAAAFEERAACLVEQFDEQELAPGRRVDGLRALPANLADLAGLRAAYEAMRAERIAHPAAEARVLGFAPDQQFFLAYAQSMCTIATEEELAYEDEHGARLPARLRVNGPLANLPEFARAFRCGEGKPMVRPPAARCDVW